MANGQGQTFYSSDKLQRSVWVVVDPQDVVTGTRVTVPLTVELKNVPAKPLAARSNVYCFMDLNLPPDQYTAQIRPLAGDRERYFEAEQPFTLDPVPLPSQPLKRNQVIVELLPRPGYPFDAQATLVRGRLVKASDSSPIPNAKISLLLSGVNKGKGQTDERGEFVVFFPREAPRRNSAATPIKEIKFRLQFEISGPLFHLHPVPPNGEDTVTEGTTKSIEEIKFAGT